MIEALIKISVETEEDARDIVSELNATENTRFSLTIEGDAEIVSIKES